MHHVWAVRSRIQGKLFDDLTDMGIECIPDDKAFVDLSFDDSQLVESNLGGQTCPADEVRDLYWQTQCTFKEPDPVNNVRGTPPSAIDQSMVRTNEYTTRGNQHVLFRTLGFVNDPVVTFNDGWEEIWMSVNNRST